MRNRCRNGRDDATSVRGLASTGSGGEEVPSRFRNGQIGAGRERSNCRRAGVPACRLPPHGRRASAGSAPNSMPTSRTAAPPRTRRGGLPSVLRHRRLQALRAETGSQLRAAAMALARQSDRADHHAAASASSASKATGDR